MALALCAFSPSFATSSSTPVVRVPAPKPIELIRRVRFDPITMESGLSHSFVRVVIQDRRGFIWIGTMDGLNRFDGHRMTVFRHDPFDPKTLGGSEIRWILEDDEGMLWLAHGANGVTRFNPANETFERYGHDPDDPNSLAGDVIFRIFQDTLGRIWFSGPPGAGELTYLDRDSGRFTRIEMPPEPEPTAYQGGTVWGAIEGDEGRMWLAADFLVEELDPKTGELTHYFPPRPDRRVSSIVRDLEGAVWAGGQNGIYRVDRVSKRMVQNDLAVREISSMAVDDEGQFWIGTNTGLYVVDRSVARILQHYTHDARDTATLPSQRIRELFWSRSGLLWIATNEGVGTFHEDQNQFVNIGLPWTDSTATPPERNMSIGPNGSLWITHETGIARVDLEARTARVFDLASFFEDGSSADEIHADSRGGVWFSRGEAVYRFDVSRSEVSAFELPPVSPDGTRVPARGPPADVEGFAEDADGNVWLVAVRAGLFFWNRGTGRVEVLNPMRTGVAPTYSELFHVANSIVMSRSGELWVGTQTGELIAVDPATQQVSRHFTPMDYPDLHVGEINVIHEDSEGTLWLGTLVGLLRVEPEEPTFKLYGYSAMLESPAVESIQEDEAGGLWLGTRAGLVRFDPKSEQFRRYDDDDGLPSNTFLSGVWMSGTGLMAFADAGGFTLFRPGALTESSYQPPVVLTGFELMYEAQRPGKPGVLESPIWNTQEVVLDHDRNVFGFEFAALDYVSPQKNRYRYRLEGFDETWHEVDSEHRFATYTQIPPGDYTFRVELEASDGEWQSEGASIRLTVRPAWWMTTWARGAALLTVLAAIYGWHRSRLGRVRQLNLVLEERVARRTAELEDANRRLELAATTDPLTGVPNRRHYLEKAAHELAKLKRTGRALTIALADIDDFKKLNDAFGHEFGDQVLRRVAEILRSQIREQDIVARWGGEEFILLFPETDAAGAEVVAEKIRAKIEASSFEAHGKPVRVTLTIGLAEATREVTLEECTARADVALYKGKRNGKNRVVAAPSKGSPPLSPIEDETCAEP